MAGHDDGRIVFDPVLLRGAEKVLKAKPEQPAVTRANGIKVNVGAFGSVPGGAGAGGRVDSWMSRTRTELGNVAAEVADLGTRTGRAAEMAAEADPLTRAAAEIGTPTYRR